MSDKILTRTRSWIMNSGLSEGDRLPPERTLCTMLGVTRSELRKSLLLLEAEGLLTRHVGRGTYLARRPGGAGSAGLEATVAALSETTGPIEAMSARIALEPETAALAALHATPAQLRELRRLCQATRWQAVGKATKIWTAVFTKPSQRLRATPCCRRCTAS